VVDSVKYLTDQESLQELIEQMPEPERSEFKSYRSRTLEPAFSGRIMVVYDLGREGPENIELLRFLDFWLAFQEAPRFRVQCRGKDYPITPVPSRIASRDVFMSVPQNFVLRWAGQITQTGLQFRPQYAVLIQTKSKESALVEGHTNCVTLKRFKERYPHLADQVRF
jgi:hypothetical protein